MQFWIDLLRTGFNRKVAADRILGDQSPRGRANFSLLAPHLKRHWKKGLLGASAVLLAALLAFPQPLILRFLIDQVILEKRLDWLVWALFGLAAVKGLSVVAGMVEQYIFSRFRMDVSLDLQRSLLDHTLQLPKTFFDDKEVGYLMSRVVSDAEGLSWFFSQTAMHILTNLLRFVGGLVFLFLLDWRLAIIGVIALPLLVASARVFSKRFRALSHHSMEQHANVLTRFQETLSSIPLIKSFRSEDRETQRIMAEVKTAQRIQLEQTVVGSVAQTIFNLVPDLSRALVLAVGVVWVIQGDWTLGSLLAFQSYLGFVYGPALTLANINLQVQNALASLDRVANLMDIVPEEHPGSGQPAVHLRGEIEFRQVTFSYDKRENVLEDISFHIAPGERIAIVGPSGVGKTTLISLLLRFYNPSSGEVLFDGLPAAEYQLSSLRQRIGYVSQNSLLLAGTIRENLCYANPNTSQAEIERAVQAAGIEDFILSLPDQYESRIGEKGVNLSEGQKQRLAIARALIKDPDILVMDEPTSALDTLVEQSILEALPEAARGKTVFIVSHRLATIQQADRILLLKDQRLVGLGSHQELLENNPEYRKLYA